MSRADIKTAIPHGEDSPGGITAPDPRVNAIERSWREAMRGAWIAQLRAAFERLQRQREQERAA